jgi:hypothetical protein
MNDPQVLARFLARIANRSLPIRRTTCLARDHPNPIGLAPIRRAGDGRLQAVAFGRLDRPPVVVTLLDPLARTDPGLDHLGAFLNQSLQDPQGTQVWIPDAASMMALSIEGLRSRTNPHCSSLRRQLGVCLHALARIEPLAGQQVVAIATEVLGNHLITGQSPTEDADLAARLCWDDPVPGVRPERLAGQCRCHPGPSLLTVEEDERVETLRARLRTGRGNTCERDEIHHLLAEAASDSWEPLVNAWSVFCHLPFPPLPGLEVLEADSLKELTWLLGGAPYFTQHLGRTCAELEKREAWLARLEDLEARGEPVVREALRREGRVIAATVLRVRLPQKTHQPTRILLHTTQPVMRIRLGTRLKTGDARVVGIVELIRHRSGGAYLLLRVTSGVRAARLLPPGQVVDLLDTVHFAGRPRSGKHAALPTIPPAAPVPPLVVSGRVSSHVPRSGRP